MTESLQHELFGEGRFFSLPSGADFLGELSRVLIDVTNAHRTPEALSDVLVFVPNRRSARALAGRLFSGLGGVALLPPDIRPLGDAGDNDPALLGELAHVDIRPVMPSGARVGVLARLISRWHRSRGEAITAGSAISVAQNLARLLDQAALVGDVNWSKLETVLEGSDLARHWQMSADFLSILTQAWPDILQESGFSDTNAQDRLAAEALCARWHRSPPRAPVIIAGSTGTSPATRMLMRAVARLPQGAVLFPGLDTELDAAAWRNILHAPSHPQHAFAETLHSLAQPVEGVRVWPGYEEPPAQIPRRRLIQESLAPADMTADWVARLETRAAPMTRREMTLSGMQGLSLLETETESEEADVIALMLRECAEGKDQTAALVTPDAGLARRVSSRLRQWGMEVAPSSGTPLLRTRAGGFLFRVLDFVMDSGDPVVLAALLKHELTCLLPKDEKDHALTLLETGILRGLRRWEDLKDLISWGDSLPERVRDGQLRLSLDAGQIPDAMASLVELEDRCLPLLEQFRTLLAEPFSLRAFAERLAELCDVLSRHPEDDGPSLLWSGPDGSRVARFLEDAALFGDWMDPVTAHDVMPVLSKLAQTVNVPPETSGYPGIYIWGPLEARLQTCDLIILGSLNEGVWPEPPAMDGFLPRHIRSQIGLPDTEARIGLSAHDFAQLACNQKVVMTRAKRVENKPSVASRWLWRLRILASGALESLEETDTRLAAPAASYLDWARQRQTSENSVSVSAPAPRPPVEARPVTINVTDVSQLIRDPYAFYARYILGLKPLEPLSAPLGARETGIAIHRALEEKSVDASVSEIVSAFEAELRAVGGDTLFFAEREGIWLAAATVYHHWMSDRRAQVTDRFFETDYKCEFEIASGRVTLRGRADLVEVCSDGTLAITDFKTGGTPSKSQVRSGLEPQLPLLAVLAQKGQSGSGPSGATGELYYFGFGSQPGPESISDKSGEVAPVIDAAEAGFLHLMESYLQPGQPYLSGPRVAFASKSGDYDRLARRAEWADAGADPGGEA